MVRRAEPLEGGEHRNRVPPCGDIATEQEWGEGCSGQPWAPVHHGPGANQMGVFHLQDLLPQLALQALRA